MYVKFEDDKSQLRKQEQEDRFYSLILKLGLAKNHKQVNLLLLGIIAACIITAAILYDSATVTHHNAAPVKAEDNLKAGNQSEIDSTIR